MQEWKDGTFCWGIGRGVRPEVELKIRLSVDSDSASRGRKKVALRLMTSEDRICAGARLSGGQLFLGEMVGDNAQHDKRYRGMRGTELKGGWLDG